MRAVSGRAAIVRVAALVCLAAACGADGTPIGGSRITRDTVGDTVVVRVAAPGEWGDSATLVEELRIGALDGALEYTFGRIEGMAVDSAGRIYVLDRQVPVVRVFDETGVHLRSFGREGAGPGEMVRPVGVGILPDGRVTVRDEGNARFVLFTQEGQPSAEWRMPGGYSTNVGFTVDRAGHIYTPVIAVRHEAGGWDEGLLHFDAHGAIVDTVGIPYVDHPIRTLVAVGNGRAEYGAPFEPQSHWAMSPEGYVVAGVSDRYAVTLFHPDGRVLRFERPWQPAPVHPDERADAIESVTSGLRMTDPDWDWQGPAAPTEQTAYASLAAGDDGRVWVRLHRPVRAEEVTIAGRPGEPDRTRRVWTEAQVYDVWSAGDGLLGTIHMPDRFRPRVMRGDLLWGVIRDEDDVEYVVRYRVRPG